MERSKVNVSRGDAIAVLERMNLMDDVFMELCFKDAPKVVETVLRVALSMPQLRVDKVSTQEKVVGVTSRTVCFDVLAQDADGVWYNIEIQRDERGATPRRARYHSSMLDVHLSKKGKEFDALPQTVVMFVTETDTLGYGEAVTTIRRCDQNGRPFDDGQSIVYVNGEWSGDDDVGWLVADLKEKDSRKMHYEVLRHRVQSIKDPIVASIKEGNMSEEIRTILSKYSNGWKKEGLEEGMQKGIAKGKREGKRETARAMLADNMDVSLVARYTALSLEEVKALKIGE